MGAAEAAAAAAAQPQPVGDGATLYTLVQIAEEAVQYVTAAVVFCANPSHPEHLATVCTSAEQATQRAAWAAGIVLDYEELLTRELGADWLKSIQGAAQVAKD